MTTRLVHPLHGATHAYDAGEIERLKGHGWLQEGDEPMPVEPTPTLSPEAVAQLAHATVFGPQRKKPGPKPKAK